MRCLDPSQPYSSQRSPVLGENVVATSQPLAAQAGTRMLARGGNAVDAALAAAIALTVVEPCNNGVGSDAFAFVHDGSELIGLNASGRSPAGMTPERFSGMRAMPGTGWGSVTVPGAVSAWVALSERFGRLPFENLFEPAIEYARSGFPVSPIIAATWELTAPLFSEFPEFAEAFVPGGRTPRAGEWFCHAPLADTLESIATSRGESFYRGELAQEILAHSRATGGFLEEGDLAEHRADWVESVQTSFAGVEVHEIPPNGQGIAALIALAILADTDVLEHAVDSVESVHVQVEAMKLALADAHRYVADPRSMELAAADLLDPGYTRSRAAEIDRSSAGRPAPGVPRIGDTVYLAAADADGCMVSYIQSNYFAFGSGVVVPGTGISLQNRASGFSLDPGHPNCVAPGKRPFHTIIPGFVTEGGRAAAAFGVMGGPMQAQGHVQTMVRMYGHGQNPQAAADAPRWQVLSDGSLAVEERFDDEVAAGLALLGHTVVGLPEVMFGGAQIVCRAERGYVAGSDPRKDGQAVAF